MEFNFDGEENIGTTKTLFVKAINSPNGAGLWIADENAEICRWKKNCLTYNHHYKNTIPHNTKTDNFDISGTIILNP